MATPEGMDELLHEAERNGITWTATPTLRPPMSPSRSGSMTGTFSSVSTPSNT